MEEALEAVATKVLVVAKEEERRFTMEALVPRLIPLRVQETEQLPSVGATLKEFSVEARFGIVVAVPEGLEELIWQRGLTWTAQVQVEESYPSSVRNSKELYPICADVGVKAAVVVFAPLVTETVGPDTGLPFCFQLQVTTSLLASEIFAWRLRVEVAETTLPVEAGVCAHTGGEFLTTVQV